MLLEFLGVVGFGSDEYHISLFLLLWSLTVAYPNNL